MALTAQQIAEQTEASRRTDRRRGRRVRQGTLLRQVQGRTALPLSDPAGGQAAAADDVAAKVGDYADAHIDHMKIDREAAHPR